MLWISSLLVAIEWIIRWWPLSGRKGRIHLDLKLRFPRKIDLIDFDTVLNSRPLNVSAVEMFVKCEGEITFVGEDKNFNACW